MSAIIPVNTQINAQMPAPGIQNIQNGSVLESKDIAPRKAETVSDSFSYSEAPLNVGVLDGPSNYSKTPIADELQRRAQSSPKEILPQNKPQKAAKAGSKQNSKSEPVPSYTLKKQNTAGNLSALFGIGSAVLIFVMLVPKTIYKIIKHK